MNAWTDFNQLFWENKALARMMNDLLATLYRPIMITKRCCFLQFIDCSYSLRILRYIISL